jgi:hypothetical protein
MAGHWEIGVAEPTMRIFHFPVPGMGYQVAVPGPHAARKKLGSKQKPLKSKVLPTELDIDGPTSNVAYQAALGNPSLVISPQELGFLPSNYWLTTSVTFTNLVGQFFQRKNNANCRFPHKLFNALSLVEHSPAMFSLLGVKWVTDRIFKVGRLVFTRLLGISSIDGGLFHRQGNLPSHGFC